MILRSVSLVSGVSKSLAVTGRYLRILSGEGDIDFTVQYKGGSMSAEIIAGIGIDLSYPEDGSPFNQVTFKSAISQDVKFLVSWFPSTDSRLAGDVDVNGLLQVVNSGGSIRDSSVVAVPPGVATKLLNNDLARLKAALNFSADCYIGKDNAVTNLNGYPVFAGTDWVDENTAEFWVYSASAMSVRILQDLK